jgi:O-antigen/teichoic acid export membrane protein
MSRVKSAFFGSLSSHVFMILNMLVSIVATPLILKFLDREEYGFYVILFQIIGYLSVLDLGLGGAITRSLASNRGEDEVSKLAINRIVSTSFFTYSFLGAVVIILGFCFAPIMPKYFAMHSALSAIAVPITLTLSIFIGLQFPLKVFGSIFYAHQRQLLSNTVGFSITLLNTILPVILLYLGQGLWSFVYTNIVCSLIYIIATFVLMRKYYPFLKISRSYFQKNLLQQLFNFGFFLFLGSVAYQVVFFTDRFFIGAFVSLTAATMYSLTIKAPDILRELIFKITDNALPAMVEIGTKEAENKSKTVHQKLLLITVCLSGIAFWLMYILNQWFLLLWVGNQYFAGQSILFLALVIMVQHNILHVSGLSLYGIGVIKGSSLMQIAEAILNLGLTIWLGKIYGIEGILSATIIACWLSVMWYIPYITMVKLKIKFYEYLVKPILIPLFFISLAGSLLYFLANRFFATVPVTWISFVLVSGTIAFLLAIMVWIAFLRNELAEYVPVRYKKYLFIS